MLTMFRELRFGWFGLGGLLLLLISGCQTLPPPGEFTSQQVARLEQAGFQRKGDGYHLDISSRLLFDFDRSDLRSDTAASLDRIARSLVEVAISGARVEGHTDDSGAEDYNQALSERRAQVVAEVLINAGMQRSRMRVVGRGESDPIELNETEEGRTQNRRVVIVVTPADAMPL